MCVRPTALACCSLQWLNRRSAVRNSSRAVKSSAASPSMKTGLAEACGAAKRRPRRRGYALPGTIDSTDIRHDTTTGATVLRRLARPLLGATFIASGVDMMRDSESRSRRAQALGIGDPQSVTRGIAGAQVGAGALLVLGRFPR